VTGVTKGFAVNSTDFKEKTDQPPVIPAIKHAGITSYFQVFTFPFHLLSFPALLHWLSTNSVDNFVEEIENEH